MEDLFKSYFVLAEKKNNRIIKQNGAFILFGLKKKSDNVINDYRLKEGGLLSIYVIDSKAKKNIINTLEQMNINKASLFPEISNIAIYMKEKYLRGK